MEDLETRRSEIESLLETGSDATLRAAVADLHPADTAELIEGLESYDQQLRVFGLLDAEHASEALRDMNEATQASLVESLSNARVAAVVERLDSDDAADLLGEVPEHRQREILDRANPEVSRDVEELLAYPEDSAGGIMKTEVAMVAADESVGGTTDTLRARKDEFHDVHNVFVVDPKHRLLGLVPLRRLLLADDGTPVSDIMERDVVSVGVEVDQEEVAHLFEKYDLLSLPVVDALDRLVGRITIDDIVDVIEEEATEDMLAMAGVADEALTPVPPLESVRTRLPWLALNLVAATAGAMTISLFEDTIRQVAVAAGLMTIVASQGGNAAAQTMTLIIRGLAVGDLRPSQAGGILARECATAATNGAVLGLLAGGVTYAWRGDAMLSGVLAGAMVLNLLVAAVTGSLIPLGLRALGVDPAVSSSVLVITATDILGFFVFLGLLTLAL